MRTCLGDIHFIMPDGRYCREAGGRQRKDVENPSLLGPVQLAWLKETLRHSRGASDRLIPMQGQAHQPILN